MHASLRAGVLIAVAGIGAGCLTRTVSRPEPTLSMSVPAVRPGWTLAWSDEFDRDGAPDPARWNPEVGMIRNAELQTYTKNRPENARIENGMLVIEARKEPYEKAGYTSASLTTSERQSFTYGRIEARIKLPGGRGTWPAFWMLGDAIKTVGWPACGEIDIMEHVGYDPDKVHCTVHTGAFNWPKGTQRGKALDTPAPFADFHVYAVEWTEQRMDFYFDRQVVFSFTNDGTGKASWPFDAPHYLILNLAIGGGWGGQKGVDDTIFPCRMLVDYVRVYRKS